MKIMVEDEMIERKEREEEEEDGGEVEEAEEQQGASLLPEGVLRISQSQLLYTHLSSLPLFQRHGGTHFS